MVARLANSSEAKQLAACEEVIERGLDSFIEVGNALLQIRENRLYRNDYDDFETYCRERWDMCGRRAHQLIDSAKVIANIGTEPLVQLPSSERSVRPLKALPPPQQKVAWKAAVESSKNGKPTAREVVAAVQRTCTITPRVGLHGAVKNSITLQALKKLWKRASEPDREAFRKFIAA